MTLAVQIVAIIFMLTLIFIGIWSFILFNKCYGQLKYKNYILEKIEYHLSQNSMDKEIIDEELDILNNEDSDLDS